MERPTRTFVNGPLTLKQQQHLLTVGGTNSHHVYAPGTLLRISQAQSHFAFLFLPSE